MSEDDSALPVTLRGPGRHMTTRANQTRRWEAIYSHVFTTVTEQRKERFHLQIRGRGLSADFTFNRLHLISFPVVKTIAKLGYVLDAGSGTLGG